MEYSPKLAVVVLLALASAMAVTAQNSEQDFVDAHNAARADVGLGEVTWDATVAAFAQDYADQRRGDCQLVHSGGQYGENLYGGGGGGTAAI
uniref:SCP domain-containing protein n=2 Tax=Triticum urartu TaxID=4572 RepID=A0A8R7RBP4_TRIUA